MRSFITKYPGLQNCKINCNPGTDVWNTIKRFSKSIENANANQLYILLIDTDVFKNAINTDEYIINVKAKLPNAVKVKDSQLNFMVQCMEAWFLADTVALKTHFKKKFNIKQDVEKIENPVKWLRDKTKSYTKGGHAPRLLSLINPQKVCDRAPHGKRLFDTLNKIKTEN